MYDQLGKYLDSKSNKTTNIVFNYLSKSLANQILMGKVLKIFIV